MNCRVVPTDSHVWEVATRRIQVDGKHVWEMGIRLGPQAGGAGTDTAQFAFNASPARNVADERKLRKLVGKSSP